MQSVTRFRKYPSGLKRHSSSYYGRLVTRTAANERIVFVHRTSAMLTLTPTSAIFAATLHFHKLQCENASPLGFSRADGSLGLGTLG